MNIEEIKSELKKYDGPEISIMEVCGSHTAAIRKIGIETLLSPRIRLIHGPGCPVCVAVSSYVDRLIALSEEKDTVVVTFGDMLRIPGTKGSLLSMRNRGSCSKMVYSPMELPAMALENPDTDFVFAAVGFETTVPVYALLMEELTERNIRNVKLLTACKTMPPVLRHLLSQDPDIDAFLAPGHVSVITGVSLFRPLAESYQRPFVVAGFSGEELLYAIHTCLSLAGRGEVANCYPSVVQEQGNPAARELVDRYFIPADAAWRGFGVIPDSGLVLREEYRDWDAGSLDLTEDIAKNPACRCESILSGKAEPRDCPLFGKSCTPTNPQGACMVSEEGACAAYYRS